MMTMNLSIIYDVRGEALREAILNAACPERARLAIRERSEAEPASEEKWVRLVITDDAKVAGEEAAAWERGTFIVYVGALSDVKDVRDRLYEVWDGRWDGETYAFAMDRLVRSVQTTFDEWFYRHALYTTIDNVPDMLWYKRVDGIHMLVNNAFTEIVRKPKSDIHGRDHFYIWNAPRPSEGNAFACAESEEIAISTGKMYVGEEPVKTGDGFKQFATYKTPMYDMVGNIFGTVGVGHDLTYQRAYEQILIRAANTDMLTELNNRRYFYQYISENARKPMLLLYMDLDGFKLINDTYGHAKGDEVLIYTARLLEKYFEGCTFARLGGDEFIVAANLEDRENVLRQARDFERELEAHYREEGIRLTVSIGMAESDGGDDVEAQILRADNRMYAVKREHHRSADGKA